MSSKFLIFLLFIVITAAMAKNTAYVWDCNEVCDRVERERHECCRSRGYRKGMDGGQCFRFKAFCIKN